MGTIRAQIVLSEDLDQEINRAVQDSGSNRSEVVRKALTLYMTALEKKKQGLKLGFARQDQTLETEVIGL
jgi:metal-responsive CopG/Arc/MetJ family transcriptional regulator